MKVICIFPVYENSDNISDLVNNYALSIGKELKVLGATQVEFKFPGIDYTWVAVNETLEGTPKDICYDCRHQMKFV